MNIINGRIVSVEAEDITGDVGVVITGNTGLVISGQTGPIHLGDGNKYVNSPIIEGPGATIVQGNSRGIRGSFPSKKKSKK